MNRTINPDALPLDVRSAHKSYEGGGHTVHALRGVDLQVERGRFVAIMGASGSGKSTLLHLMAGLTHCDKGSVEISGVNIGKLNDQKLTKFRRHHIGLVFQSFNLMPTLNAMENVALPLMLDGAYKGEAKQRVLKILEDLGLADRVTHKPDSMSGGEQQRVAIGRALVNEPEILMADEPTGNLDSQNSELVCGLLRTLSNEEDKTIVMVTHEPTVAIYADEVWVMKDGRFHARFDTDQYSDAIALGKHYQEVLAEGASVASTDGEA